MRGLSLIDAARSLMIWEIRAFWYRSLMIWEIRALIRVWYRSLMIWEIRALIRVWYRLLMIWEIRVLIRVWYRSLMIWEIRALIRVWYWSLMIREVCALISVETRYALDRDVHATGHVTKASDVKIFNLHHFISRGSQSSAFDRSNQFKRLALFYEKESVLAPVSTEKLPPPDPRLHHQLSHHRNSPVHIHKLLQDNKDDPAFKQFIPKLKDHVLCCLWVQDSDGPTEFSSDDRNNIVICNNPVRPIPTGGANTQKTQMEILFVRWFDPVQHHHSGIKAARLPKVAFVPEINDSAFSFVDPASVVCGVHLILAFADGRVQSTLQQKSVGCIRREDDEWTSYYVNIFVDCDMFIRFTSTGV
ncbi:uncharacterized protein HD556DRAFT_1479428 [Suillus plorans]|uniref:Uncharacterized protein n=1 Tax=Suillus plorans TaxID=116603 RepID=A0A9P7AQ68_9AGAM|nr:uncharacterized protein HD556DRAFT_1479428 [Suillus plorans]KAG1793327.1 hypothetical protein HD556DRAFT_1479428 [Suillus plorans]